jgi:hypothetical protein
VTTRASQEGLCSTEFVGVNGSVIIVAGYGLNDRGFDSREGQGRDETFFLTTSKEKVGKIDNGGGLVLRV